jgi:hypothetical protein
MKILSNTLSAVLLSVSLAASAQTPPPPYGAPISLAQARKVAEAEAKKNKWNVVIAIVDSGGNLVLTSEVWTSVFRENALTNDRALD